MHKWIVLSIVVLLLAGIIVGAVFLRTRQVEDDYPRPFSSPTYVSISADGNYIAAVYMDTGDVMLFGRGDNTPLWHSKMDEIMEAVTISENGDYIAVGGRRNVYLFSKDNVTPLWSANVGGADGIQISSDGNYIVGMYGDIYFFSKDNNEPLWSIGGVISFALASDGSRLAVASDDKIYLLGSENSDPLWSFDAGETLWFTVTSISSDGNYMVVGSGNGKLYLFGGEDNLPRWIYYSDKYLKPAISADGNYIAAAYDAIPDRNEGDLYLFSRTENSPLWMASCPPRPEVVISSNGDYIAVAGVRYIEYGLGMSARGELYFFSRTSSTPLWTYQFPKNIWVDSVSMSAGGQYIAVGAMGYSGPNIATSIYLFSKDSNQPLWVYYHEVNQYS